MKIKPIFLGILFVLVIVSIGLIFLQRENSGKKLPERYLTSNKLIKSDEIKLWSKKIDSIGAQKAYEEFKGEYKNMDFATQHQAAHLFGNILYQKIGIDGLSICDDTFVYGCYHVFLARALSEKGLGIIPTLYDACQKKYGSVAEGCQHGIGHGLMEYFGGNYNNLLKVLALCREIPSKNYLNGCYTGAFMEYNLPVVITDKSTASTWRKFDLGNPYEPCGQVEGKYRLECYSTLGLWWHWVLGGDYEKIGKLCNGIKDNKGKEICFIHIGKYAVTMSSYDADLVLAKCKQMPSEEAEFICRKYAYRIFKEYSDKEQSGRKLCDGYNERNRNFCMQINNDFDNIGKQWLY